MCKKCFLWILLIAIIACACCCYFCDGCCFKWVKNLSKSDNVTISEDLLTDQEMIDK